MNRKPIPSPQERPDLYDYPDFTDGRPKLSQTYMDKITPKHVKKLLAERKVNTG